MTLEWKQEMILMYKQNIPLHKITRWLCDGWPRKDRAEYGIVNRREVKDYLSWAIPAWIE